jgi:hypothetical protein
MKPAFKYYPQFYDIDYGLPVDENNELTDDQIGFCVRSGIYVSYGK